MTEVFQSHIEALFTHTDEGDLDRVNDWRGERGAPLFYLGRDFERRYVRFHKDVSPEARDQINRALSGETVLFSAPPEHSERYVEILQQNESVDVRFGPAYWFADKVQLQDNPEIVQITAQNQSQLEPKMPDWLPDVDFEQPMMGWLESGEFIGVCGSVRTSDFAVAAGLEVIPSARCQGIGYQLTEAWAAQVQQLGKIALYSTSSDNSASQGVARRLGLALLGSDYQISRV